MPDMEVNHQKCLGHQTKKVLNKGYKIPDDISQACKLIKMDLPECKKCPQLAAKNGLSEYAAFTGGFMPICMAAYGSHRRLPAHLPGRLTSRHSSIN